MSRPTRARGLKRLPSSLVAYPVVAPHAGAWIETLNKKGNQNDKRRAPRGRVD